MNKKELLSKNNALLILIVLFISIVAAFVLTYNKLVVCNASINIWISLFLLIPIAIGILLFMQYTLSLEQIANLNAEIESQKKQRDKEIHSTKETKNSQSQSASIDIDSIIEKIIPNIDPTDIEKYGEIILQNISKSFDIVQGTLHTLDTESGLFSQIASYAFFTVGETTTYRIGETLSGQVAKNQRVLNLDKVPENYISIMSGLGKASPKSLLIIPVVSPEKQTIAIIEISSFKPFNQQMEELFTKLGNKLGSIISPIFQNHEEA